MFFVLADGSESWNTHEARPLLLWRRGQLEAQEWSSEFCEQNTSVDANLIKNNSESKSEHDKQQIVFTVFIFSIFSGANNWIFSSVIRCFMSNLHLESRTWIITSTHTQVCALNLFPNTAVNVSYWWFNHHVKPYHRSAPTVTLITFTIGKMDGTSTSGTRSFVANQVVHPAEVSLTKILNLYELWSCWSKARSWPLNLEKRNVSITPGLDKRLADRIDAHWTHAVQRFRWRQGFVKFTHLYKTGQNGKRR